MRTLYRYLIGILDRINDNLYSSGVNGMLNRKWLKKKYKKQDYAPLLHYLMQYRLFDQLTTSKFTCLLFVLIHSGNDG